MERFGIPCCLTGKSLSFSDVTVTFLLMKIFLFLIFLIFPFCAKAETFPEWLSIFKTQAVKQGISPELIDKAFQDINPIERVIELDRKQPEGKWTFAQYKEKVVNPVRIAQGRRMMREHEALLKQTEEKYGVAPQYIVALWGIETSYGNITGGFDIVPALATLAWEGRRAEFFTKELINALKIVDQGHIDLNDLRGSWAGAMGQNQFMPSSFHAFAQDGNGDGKKDIWGSLPDVFASSSNYLKKNKWISGQRWGREVSVPDNLPESLIDLKNKKSLTEWQNIGITKPDGSPIPNDSDIRASLVAPDGIGGPTYLVYNNYNTIMRWNRSTYFATSVGLLADAISTY